MAWPNSSRVSGYIVQPADWNEIAAALATWGGDSNAGGYDLNNAAVVKGTAFKSAYQQVAGAATVTPEISNGYIEIDLDRASTTIAAPVYKTSGTLLTGVKFRLKLKHSLDGSDVVWNAAYKGVGSWTLPGVNGQYSVFEFMARPDGAVELCATPLIGMSNT